jgi:hypothetical protein
VSPPASPSKESGSEAVGKRDGVAETPVAKVPLETTAPHQVAGEPEPIFPASLWLEPDVRWLTGVHEAGGHNYLVQEPFEELLWWLQLPHLLTLAGHSEPDRPAAAAIAKSVNDAIAAVAATGYQADKLLAFDRRNRKKDAAVAENEEVARNGTAKKPAGQAEESQGPELSGKDPCKSAPSKK